MSFQTDTFYAEAFQTPINDSPYTIPMSRKYIGSRIYAPQTLHSYHALATGKFSVFDGILKSPNAGSTAIIFNVKLDGEPCWSGGARPSIAPGQSRASKTGFEFDVTRAVTLVEIVIEQVPSIGVVPPISTICDVVVDLYATVVDMSVLAECELDVFISLSTRVNLAVLATCDLTVDFDGETEVDMAVLAEVTLKLDGEIDTFGETEVDLVVLATCDLSQTQIGNTQVDMAVLAECDLYVTDAEQFVTDILVDLVPDPPTSRSERRAILTVDGEPIQIKEAEWIEDEGSTDDRLIVTLPHPDLGASITRDSVITFELQRKISGVWTTTTVLLANGQVDETSLEHGRKNGANADVFSFTGQTPLQVRFNVTPLTDLIMFDPQKLTLEAEDFDLIPDSNGNTHEVELMPMHRMKMNSVFEEVFNARMGFDDWHSDLPDEFLELTRVDFRGGQPMTGPIRELIGFFSADFQLIGNEIWIKDGTAEHPSSLPVRQVTIREGKLKNLAVTEKFERYDGVDLTYNERALEYDFVTERTDVLPPRSVTVGGITTVTQNTNYVTELRRNSQPDRIIDEKIMRITQSVTQNGYLIKDSTDRRTYDLYGNLTRKVITIDARIPDLLTGLFLMRRVREVTEEQGYRGHPFRLEKIFRYRTKIETEGLILVDAANPMLGQPARQDISTAYQALNLAEGQSTEFGAIEHYDEWVQPLRDDKVYISRQRVNYVNPMVEEDPEEEKVGDIGISTLISREMREWVFPRGVYDRTPDKLLPLDAMDISLRFAEPVARRHLSMLKNLPKRVSATAIDFDETIIKGSTVNFRGRGGIDLGVHRILSRRLSIRPRAWTASYTARQVGVSSTYILVDNEDPYTPGEMALNSNEQKTFILAFECFEGYYLRCDPIADVLVEARAVGDTDWTALESTPIDMEPWVLTVQHFEIRVTTGTISSYARRRLKVYASL
jgi:hypothetical protein